MRGIYLAEGALLTQQQRLELAGNNLINQRTPGYKRDETVQTSFGEWMIRAMGTVKRPASGSTTADQERFRNPRISTMAHSTAVAETYTDMKSGNLRPTGRSLDMAIIGNAFFQVMSEDGLFYTRNGHFFVDEGGYLVNEKGDYVLGEDGTVHIGYGDFLVTAEGDIMVNGELVDRLDLMPFDPAENYTKVGDNYFEPVEMMGIESEFSVFQGYLEDANVDLVKEMTAIMDIRRSFEAAHRVMMTHDNILRLASNDLGSLR